MDHKPDAGFKIKDTCFGNIKMMMTLELVMGKNEYESAAGVNGTAPAEDSNHESKVFKYLADPWRGKGDRMVAEY